MNPGKERKKKEFLCVCNFTSDLHKNQNNSTIWTMVLRQRNMNFLQRFDNRVV